jgi:hypothetical protein
LGKRCSRHEEAPEWIVVGDLAESVPQAVSCRVNVQPTRLRRKCDEIPVVFATFLFFKIAPFLGVTVAFRIGTGFAGCGGRLARLMQ